MSERTVAGALAQEQKHANMNNHLIEDSMLKVIGKVSLEQMREEHKREDLSEEWDHFGREVHIEWAEESSSDYINWLAETMEWRRSRQGEDTPFIGRLGDIEFTVNPKNPSRVYFAGEDNLSSATIDKDDEYVEYGFEGFEPNILRFNYNANGLSASDLNLRRIILVTNEGEINEQYSLSEGIHFSGESQPSEIVADFVSNHPEYEIGESDNTFVRSNIDPFESISSISSEPLDGFKVWYRDIIDGEYARKMKEREFEQREGQDPNSIKTYGDIIPFAEKFGERCRKVYNIATAAYEKSLG